MIVYPPCSVVSLVAGDCEPLLLVYGPLKRELLCALRQVLHDRALEQSDGDPKRLSGEDGGVEAE